MVAVRKTALLPCNYQVMSVTIISSHFTVTTSLQVHFHYVNVLEVAAQPLPLPPLSPSMILFRVESRIEFGDVPARRSRLVLLIC